MDRDLHLPRGGGRPSGPEDLAGLAPAARLAALGRLTPSAVHELNNWLFGIVAQTELLLGEPGLAADYEDRLRSIAESGAGLTQVVRRLGAAARGDVPAGPLQLDDEVRTVLALPGFAESELTAPPAPIRVAGEPALAAQVVFQVLVSLLGQAPDVELAVENGAAVLAARPTRSPRLAPADDAGLVLGAAEALARSLGGSLTRLGDGALRLSLPLDG